MDEAILFLKKGALTKKSLYLISKESAPKKAAKAGLAPAHTDLKVS